MGYVRDYEHDVFVSYASVDNQPPVGVDNGWVTYLVMELKRVLAEELGRSEEVAIWMDQQLAANDPITPTLLEAVGNSATIIVILSAGYLESDWCLRERNEFLARMAELAEQGNRIFLVEKTAIEWNEKPLEIRDVKGKAFWYKEEERDRIHTLGSPCPRPLEEPEYYRQVSDLARDLADQLQAMQGDDVGTEQTPSVTGPRVVLADVTDDLVDKREEVRRYLQQHGVSVIEKYYPSEPQAFLESFNQDLESCALYVQLLSSLTGKRPPGAEQGYPVLQFDAARSAAVDILQWYPPDLDVDKLEDGPQKDLLLQKTVVAEPFEQFKARVVKRAQPEPERSHEPNQVAAGASLIFVNHGAEDRKLAEEVSGVADELELEYALPVSTGSPGEIRETMETCMRESDAMVLLYGEVPETWVVQQLLQFRKYRNLKGRTRKGLALVEGPPQEKHQIRMKLADMYVLDCRNGTPREKVRDFLLECARGELSA
jgi:hypothetical protein